MDDDLPTPGAATRHVFDSLTKIAGLAAGIVSIAYLIGWIYAEQYWLRFHSSWVLDLLSSGQVLADAKSLVLPMVWAALLSIISVLNGVKEKTLSYWFRAFLLLATFSLLLDLIPVSIVAWSTIRRFLILGPALYMAAEGVGIGILVRSVRESKLSWNKFIADHVTWLISVLIFTVPWYAAYSQFEFDSRASSSPLPVVTWPSQPTGDWRLGRAIDKGFIVIKLTADPDVTEVRLLPFDASVLIRPINQPII